MFQASTKERDSLGQRCDLIESKRNELETRNSSLAKELKSTRRELASAEQELERRRIEFEDCKEKNEATAKSNSAYFVHLYSYSNRSLLFVCYSPREIVTIEMKSSGGAYKTIRAIEGLSDCASYIPMF